MKRDRPRLIFVTTFITLELVGNASTKYRHKLRLAEQGWLPVSSSGGFFSKSEPHHERPAEDGTRGIPKWARAVPAEL